MTPVEILEAAQKIWDISHTGVSYKIDLFHNLRNTKSGSNIALERYGKV